MTDRQIEATFDESAIPAYSPDERTCSLTTFGRKNGRAHDVEMRYAMRGDTMYLLSDEGGEAEWVQNLIKNPEVSVRMDNQSFTSGPLPLPVLLGCVSMLGRTSAPYQPHRIWAFQAQSLAWVKVRAHRG
jgi:F420H(2)-dependent quinone reductase